MPDSANPPDPASRPEAIGDAFVVTSTGTAGLTHKQTRSSRFLTPSRGVRIDVATPDLALARTAAASIVCSDGTVVTDLSAARLWDLPLPPWIAFDPTRPISVAATADRARPQRRDVHGRRLSLPPEHVTTLRDMQVTVAARTWLDCAQYLPPEHVIAMGDALLHRGLAGAADVRDMVAWGTGRRGVATARLALRHLDADAESPGESLARAHLVLAGVPRPECNVDIVVDGEWLARADVAWRSARLIAEYDGAVHWSEEQRRSDAARRNLLQAAGWQVIVLTANDLRRPWLMVNLVRNALQQRRDW
jgi:hypothetical protein